MTPAVMGIDLSLTCSGVALADGTTTTIRPGALRGMPRLAHILFAVGKTLADEPALVVLEGYSFGSGGRATVSLGELGGVVRLGLHLSAQRWLEVPPGKLKIYATGTGRSDKTAMVVAARERLGYGDTQPDEADALWLRAFGLGLLGAPVVDLPKTHRRALVGVALPAAPAEEPPHA